MSRRNPPDDQPTLDSPQTYHILINGVRHCVVRFRQLHALHEQLRRELPFPAASLSLSPAASGSRPAALPPFPPKKLLPLTVPQLEERRATLEKYLQRLSQASRTDHELRGVELDSRWQTLVYLMVVIPAISRELPSAP